MRGRIGGLMLTLAATDALAWRCNTYLVEPGQTDFEVRERCGDPLDVQRRTEWRVQYSVQQSCQVISEPVPAPAVPGVPPPPPAFRTRTVCTPYTVPITVPVEVELWYYDDASVPKLLHFENGRLAWIEPLWGLRR